MKRVSQFLFAFLLVLVLALGTACGGEGAPESSPGTTPPAPSEQPGEEEPGEVEYSKNYTPTSFTASSLTYGVTQLGDGVRMVKNSYTLKSGRPVVMYATEIDLSKADVRATSASPDGGLLTRKLVPYEHMSQWEAEHPGQKVMFATNADYFGSTCVNAFVKDGVIIKDSHNDNGSYDYKNSASDVPASAPMLFGIKDGKAQIAAMTDYGRADITDPAVKATVVKSKLFYEAVFSGENANYPLAVDTTPYSYTDRVCFLKDTETAFRVRKNSVVVKVSLEEGGLSGHVVNVTKLEANGTITPEQGVAYLVAHPDCDKASSLKRVEAEESLAVRVASEDGTWTGYTTILGCRHELLRNGKIVSTVALEDSNNTAITNVPRTAVAVKKDGTVVLFSVEALSYGKYAQEGDTYGLSLAELADFIRYYDCENAANFDGGGSTQVVVREGYNGSGDPKVVVRSSDTGSSELASSRTVINAFLVTTKQK